MSMEYAASVFKDEVCKVWNQAFLPSPPPTHVSEGPLILQPDYIYQPIPYPTHFNREDGGNVFLWNIGIRLPDYVVSQPRRPQSEQAPPWKPQNFYFDNSFLQGSIKLVAQLILWLKQISRIM
jgi:hypothetical protein